MKKFAIFTEDGRWQANIYGDSMERIGGAWFISLADKRIAGIYSGNVVLELEINANVNEAWEGCRIKLAEEVIAKAEASR